MPKLTSGRWAIPLLALLLIIQFACTLFFVSELATEVFGLRDWALTWEMRELLQVLASAGLLAGTLASALLLWRSIRHSRSLHRQLKVASGAFFTAFDECMDEWALSPSEREVALAALRGYSNAEIAGMRGTSETTVKTQMNAVLRKAGVANRAQLLSHFVDLIIAESGRNGTDRQAPVLRPKPVAQRSGVDNS